LRLAPVLHCPALLPHYSAADLRHCSVADSLDSSPRLVMRQQMRETMRQLRQMLQ
jgi:hypothetical protein